MSRVHLKKIVDILKGQQTLAAALHTKDDPITQAHVWKWLNTTKYGIPERHVIKACKAVDWEVTPHELRPDIYPHPHDGLPQHLREVA